VASVTRWTADPIDCLLSHHHPSHHPSTILSIRSSLFPSPRIYRQHGSPRIIVAGTVPHPLVIPLPFPHPAALPPTRHARLIAPKVPSITQSLCSPLAERLMGRQVMWCSTEAAHAHAHPADVVNSCCSSPFNLYYLRYLPVLYLLSLLELLMTA